LFTHSVRYPWAPEVLNPPQWFRRSFTKRNKAALSWYSSKLKLFGGLPSFQHQIQLLNHTRRFLAYRNPWTSMHREVRYPYLDRDLLEFVCAIPREQVVGVGKRRFLMKRALAGIVPDELLNRKQRMPVASSARATSIPEGWPNLERIGHHFISSELGIVDAHRLLHALENVSRIDQMQMDSLKRTLCLEFWLRHLTHEGVLSIESPATGQCTPAPLSRGDVGHPAT